MPHYSTSSEISTTLPAGQQGWRMCSETRYLAEGRGSVEKMGYGVKSFEDMYSSIYRTGDGVDETGVLTREFLGEVFGKFEHDGGGLGVGLTGGEEEWMEQMEGRLRWVEV